jgi:hypothetical protein
MDQKIRPIAVTSIVLPGHFFFFFFFFLMVFERPKTSAYALVQTGPFGCPASFLTPEQDYLAALRNDDDAQPHDCKPQTLQPGTVEY